jgi:6-phosphogluconolactonase (cycloisomerase 2 family)
MRGAGKLRPLIATAVASGFVFASAAEAKQFAYEPNFDTNTGVAALSVGANGALAALPGSPFATAGEDVEGLAITADAKRLYTVSVASPAHIFGFTINADGTLAPIPGATKVIGATAYGVAITPNGKFVYVANFNDDTISEFAIGGDGSLTELAGSPLTTSFFPAGFAVSSDGRFLYVAHASSPGRVSAYSIGADGALSPLTTPFYTTGTAPFSINLTPDGKFLYVAARAPDNKVFGFSVAGDGSLTPLPSAAPSTGANPFGMTITPDGSRLFTANFNSGSIGEYSIAQDGALALVTAATPVLNSPGDVTTNAEGSRLFASNAGRTSIDVFGLPTGGASLSPISGSPFASGVVGDFESIVLTPDQPPAASFTYTNKKGTTSFDAGGTTDPDGGTVARYDWNFGDGTTLPNGGPTPTHNYAKGTFTASLTVTDDQGCSTTYIANGETAFCNGSGLATTTRTVDTVPPKLKLSAKKKQPLGKPVKIKAGCNEDCTVKASGKIKIAGEGKFNLKRASASRAGGSKATLKLKLSGKARKAAKDASKGKAKVEVTATDKAGNEATAKAKVKLRG